MRKQDQIMNLKEEKIKSTKVFDGKLLKVYKDEVLCPNNDKTTREYVIHCKAAAILPITDQGKIILEKQNIDILLAKNTLKYRQEKQMMVKA